MPIVQRAVRTIEVPDGSVSIESVGAGRNLVRFDGNSSLQRAEVQSGFPIDLLASIVSGGGAWGVEEIARHEAPEYVMGAIRRQIQGYFEQTAFAGKRLLDFGSGSGASTFGLAQMLPRTDIIGVELDSDKFALASSIAQHRRLANVRFLQSPSGTKLPSGIGQFDFVMLSAVWEHLLPEERPIIASLLWGVLKPGGALLINQTPYRWAPLEHHTTGLWLINYMPDFLAGYLARNHARETPTDLASCDWPQLLRRGIRGGTEREVLRHLRGLGGSPVVMAPLVGTRADYWFAALSSRFRAPKRVLAALFNLTDKLLGTMPVTHLDMVIRKS